ncbi:MAG: STAS domain-containing protein [Verrucomicrobiota bacterium]
MQETQILVARQGSLAFIQVKGRGSFQNAGALKSFYQEMLAEEVVQFVIDLEKCTYMDSTFMGTLAGLGAKLKQRPDGGVRIVNVGERSLEMLRNLGLDRVVTISLSGVDYQQPSEREMSEAPAPDQSKREITQGMLEAHETLAAIDASNAPKFKDVLAYLKEDLGKTAED